MKEGFGDAKAGFDDTKAGFDDTKAGFDEVKAAVDELKGGFGEEQGEMKRGFDDTKAEFGDVKNELAMVKKKLDKVAESTQESLMRLKDLQAPNYPYPHLVVVKEVGSTGTSSNAHGVKRWLGKLRAVGKKDMTLHFLCPVDMTTVWWRRLSVSGDAWLGEESIAGDSGGGGDRKRGTEGDDRSGRGYVGFPEGRERWVGRGGGRPYSRRGRTASRHIERGGYRRGHATGCKGLV